MTNGHLDAARLAEHAEGLLPADQAAGVDAHLQTCEACQATAADLASVSAMLAAAPPALPTPAHVVARLERALADEAEPSPEPAPVVPLSWFRHRAPQLLAAAATVGVLGFAGWVVTTTSGGGDDAADSAAEPATAESGGEDEADDQAGAGESARDNGLRTTEEDAVAPFEAEEGDAAVPPGLEDEIRAVVEQARVEQDDANDACGGPLSEELGLDLVGSAATELTGEPGVLVVLQSDEPGFVDGWVLPACDATVDEARTELTVEVD